MPLKKILGYTVFKPRIYAGFNIVLDQTAVKIFLEDGSIFQMFSIPPTVAETLHALDKGILPHDEFFVIKELIASGVSPFGSIRSVSIKTGDQQRCQLKQTIAGMRGVTAFNKPITLGSCAIDDKHVCTVTLSNKRTITLSSLPGSFMLAGMYRVPITYNGQRVKNFSFLGATPCGFAMALDTNDDTTPLILGFDSSHSFLLGYDYATTRYAPHADDSRYTIERFLYQMNVNKKKKVNVDRLISHVEINSLYNDVYVAEVFTNSDISFPMIPSHALLLWKLLSLDGYIDDRLLSLDVQHMREP